VTASLETFIERQYAASARAMRQSISPVGVVKARPGFGQTIVPMKGSTVASPVPASYDPDPDYFFHWYRDSAVVMDALRLLYCDGTVGEEAVADVADFVRFSLALDALDGRKLVQSPGWRDHVATDFEQFVRPDEDLARAHGEAIRAETRVNPDGTLDISRWPRPQHDGPPMRALALLRWARTGTSFGRENDEALAALLREDLAFTRRRCREPCFDIWEEEEGLHYYTLCISAAALDEGAYWFSAEGIRDEAAACREEAAALRQSLDAYWLPEEGFYRSRVLTSGARSSKELDMAVVFAAIHAGTTTGAHSVSDPRMHATLARLEAIFENAYEINRRREPGRRHLLFGRGLLFLDLGSRRVLLSRGRRRGRPLGRAGVPRARRRLSPHGPGVHPGARRALRAIRQGYGRANLGPPSRLELCGLHLQRQRAAGHPSPGRLEPFIYQRSHLLNVSRRDDPVNRNGSNAPVRPRKPRRRTRSQRSQPASRRSGPKPGRRPGC
jgi:glucoamylase